MYLSVSKYVSKILKIGLVAKLKKIETYLLPTFNTIIINWATYCSNTT